jgi:hypothetical protein
VENYGVVYCIVKSKGSTGDGCGIGLRTAEFNRTIWLYHSLVALSLSMIPHSLTFSFESYSNSFYFSTFGSSWRLCWYRTSRKTSPQQMLLPCFHAGSSETSVNFQRTTRRYIPEDRTLNKEDSIILSVRFVVQCETWMESQTVGRRAGKLLVTRCRVKTALWEYEFWCECCLDLVYVSHDLKLATNSQDDQPRY